MMAAANSIASTGIVLEPLREGNYENWSTLVKNYLVGQGLWQGIVVNPPERHLRRDDDDEWTSKNAKALHAIQLACGSENLSYISRSEDANDAWDFLKTLFSEETEAEAESEPESEPEPEPKSADSTWINELHSFVEKGNWNAAKAYVRRHGHAATKSTRPPLRRTILHVAVASGRERIVEELLSMGNHDQPQIEQVLRMQDKRGYTALALVAELTDNKDVAEWMVDKGGRELLSIKTKDQSIPILLAAAKGHKRMTRYLFSQTPINDEFVSSRDGQWLFRECIWAEIFDVAAKLLTALGNSLAGQPLGLATANMACSALARMPSAFHSGAQLGRWDQFIYNSLRLPIHSNEIRSHDTPADVESGTTHRSPSSGRFGQFPTSVLGIFPGSEKIYEMKENHYYLIRGILGSLSEVIPTDYNERNPIMCTAYDVMLAAAKHGIIELIDSMRRAHPTLIWDMNDNKKSILAHAICNRQEKVFQLILGFQGRQKKVLISLVDWDGNNMLHHAAKLGPSSYLKRMSNPALQMQRELKWFMEVERIVPPKYKQAKNGDGLSPHELFAKEHEDLMKAGEKWARDAAKSFTLVGTLIVTIMFAAAFTVPGGNNQNTGIPIFLKRRAFLVFIVADTISLVMSSSSVLIFIEILTLRYAMKDFMKSLLRMLWGLCTLFFSVTSMMLTFVAALSLMLEEYPIAIVAATSLASIPILVLVHTLLRLSYEILKSATWTPERADIYLSCF